MPKNELVLPNYDRKLAAKDADFRSGLVAAKKGEVKKAYKHFLDSHRSGNTDATYSLGYWHQSRLIPKASDTEAAKYYRIAAAHKHTAATFHLASAYSDGRGVRKSRQIARRWYERAARLGSGEAMFNYALLSLAADEDLANAKRWLRRAAKAKVGGAKSLLRSVENGDRIMLQEPDNV